jgi:hypothetical protein
MGDFKNNINYLVLEDIISKLSKERDVVLDITTSVVVKWINPDIKERNTWCLGILTGGNLDASQARVEIRINLWGELHTILNKLEIGDTIIINNGRAINYSTDGENYYPQINCNSGAPTNTAIDIIPSNEKIVVDGSNFVYENKKLDQSGEWRPDIEGIELIRVKLMVEGFRAVIVVDASLRHKIPPADRARLEVWLNEGRVIQSPPGITADRVILQYAESNNLRVITNDKFREYVEEFPWIKDRGRFINCKIINGDVQLFPPLKL